MNTVNCDVTAVYRINGEVVRVQLQTPEPVAYQAGHYLELNIPGESFCYFSIANAPGTRDIELHMQLTGVDSRSVRIVDWLENHDEVAVTLPLGNCTLSDLPQENGPLLLIAAGTGFSQIKAIAESIMHKTLERPVHLYWSARTVSGLYMADLPETWHRADPNFHFSAIISEHNDWQEKQGLMVNAILEDFDNLEACQAITCGSPAMVYATLDELIAHGLRETHMLADVFDYAPRDQNNGWS
mgnify:CR=1 FL=1